MNKILWTIIILLVLTLVVVIPYWTGVQAEQQFEHFNQTFYPMMNLKSVDNHYERGWFHSQAQSTFEMLDQIQTPFQKQQFVLVHDINHGLLPIRATVIQTTLYNLFDNHKPLLEVQTAVQANGESVSKMTIQAYKNQNWQWQGLHGHLSVKQNATLIEAKLQSPYFQFNTDQGQVVAQQLSFNLNWQPDPFIRQIEAQLTVTDLSLTGEQETVQWAGLNIKGYNRVVGEILALMAQVEVQKISTTTKQYGPGHCDLAFQRLHIPTLKRLQNALVAFNQRNSAPTLLQVMPHGLSLMTYSPQLSMPYFNLEMPEGTLQGQLQLEFKPLQVKNFLDLLNPSHLLKAVQGQLKMSIPSSLLQTQRQSPLIDRLKVTKEGNYDADLQLTQGLLRLNGQPLPLTILLQGFVSGT